jgi:hypothetical protein
MTSDDRLLLILRRLDEIERKLDRIVEELMAPTAPIYNQGKSWEVGMTRDTIEQIVLLLYAAAIVLPFGQLLRRTGYSRWWILLSFIPIINVVGLWILEYGKWPIDKRSGQS